MHRCFIAAASAAGLLLFAGPARAESGLFVVTTDYSTGSTAFLAAGASEAEVNLLGIHSDAVGHYHDGRVYVVNRLGQDNILVLDEGGSAHPPGPVLGRQRRQSARHRGRRPRKGVREPLRQGLPADRRPPRRSSELGEIDLSAFADADGLPEVSQIARVGERLYLSCQRLDRDGGWGPADISYLIAVDLATDTLVDVDPDAEGVQGIALSASNPNSMVVIGERIAVGVVVNFGDRSGGVEIVDTAADRSLGLAVSEEDLGGDITSMVLRRPGPGLRGGRRRELRQQRAALRPVERQRRRPPGKHQRRFSSRTLAAGRATA